MEKYTPIEKWWALPITELFAELKTTAEGLSLDESKNRLLRFGKNTLAEQRRVTIFERFIKKLFNPLILLLLVAAGFSGALGQTPDFVIIVVITAISIAIDVYQEHQAVGAAEKLRRRVSITATVLRDGVKKEVLLRDIVVGDIVLVTVGDIVPADCRLLASKDLLVDQSTLTGESYPQQKQAGAKVSGGSGVVNRKNCLFMGTNVITGEGTGVVVATGTASEIGKISEHLVDPRPQTEFEKGINNFGLLLMQTAIIFGVFVFVAHIFLSHEIFTSLLFVLAIVVGFAPELLPLVITINLSRGALRMLHHGVIVKSLPSIENFGSMDVLCTDKTGTLTENKIILEKYEDVFGKNSEKVLQFGYLASIFQSGFRGPMEEAVLAHKEVGHKGFTRIDVIPFDFFRKRSSVVVQKDDERLLITKGAPEEIIRVSSCTFALRKKLEKRLVVYGEQGFRVLAVAYKNLREVKKTFEPKDESRLTFLGFMVFLDPPKKTISEALARMESHHVIIKILTGDNDIVTSSICRTIGLPIAGIAKSEDVEHCSDSELKSLVEKTTIFSRLNPDQKVRVIGALRANNHIVGYMGDGINDAPSLRAADIGLSVNNATDVAKLSADIILLHKDLHVLADGMREGRVTFENVMKYLKMSVSSNFGNMVSIAIASVFLPFLPLVPVQVLLNDLLYDVSQLSLAGDRVEDVFLTKPHRWKIGNIRKFMLLFGLISSVFDIVTFLILLRLFHATPKLFQTGWFLESIATQILIIFVIRTRMVPFYKSRPSFLFAASLLGVLVFAFLFPYTSLAADFSFVRLPLIFYGILLGIIVFYMMIVEVAKSWFYARVDM